MKSFNTLFDFCLLETILAFFFSAILYILDDSYARMVFYIGIFSLVITLLLGITGYFFNLFKVEDAAEDY